MHELKQQGKIRFFGIAIDDSVEGIEAMKWEGVDTIQVVYNLFDPEAADELFPYAERENIGIIAREPLANGLLTGKYNENTYFPPGDIRHAWPVSYIGYRTRATQSLTPLLNDEIDSFAKLSLKFVLANDSVGTVIPGCKNASQAMEDIGVSNLRDLTPLELDYLNKLYHKRFNV